MGREQLMGRIAELVSQVTEARFEGAAYAKLARAHGYADGYMRALMDAGLVDRAELLRAVIDARATVVSREGSGTRKVGEEQVLEEKVA